MKGYLVLVLLLIGSVSAVSVCIDNVAPSAPGNLSVSGSVGNILVSWDAAVDTPECSGVDYYNVSRNGVAIGIILGLSNQVPGVMIEFVDNVSLGAGEYSYTVYAVDMVGGNAGASVKNDVVVDSGGSVSGGGRGGSYRCEVNWSCGEWSECVGEEMRRICEDLNKCGTLNLKPVDYLECGDGDFDGEGEGLIVSNLTEEDEVGFFSAVTGAVTGAVGTTGGAVTTVFILVVVCGAVAVRIRRRWNL